MRGEALIIVFEREEEESEKLGKESRIHEGD